MNGINLKAVGECDNLIDCQIRSGGLSTANLMGFVGGLNEGRSAIFGMKYDDGLTA